MSKSKTQQTEGDLRIQLDEQLSFLIDSAAQYDDGNVSYGKQLAGTLRILLHDTDSSHSLLGQLKLKDREFVDTSTGFNVPPGSLSVGGKSGLFGLHMPGAYYVPNLGAISDPHVRLQDFEKYWSEVVVIDALNIGYTRKEIILAVANQDGGAHISPLLDEKYASLSRNNSMGWIVGDNTDDYVAIKGAELAAVRQIAHEILLTLKADYKFLDSRDDGFVVGEMALLVSHKKTLPKVGRNDPCPCGSGKKYKKCHGR